VVRGGASRLVTTVAWQDRRISLERPAGGTIFDVERQRRRADLSCGLVALLCEVNREPRRYLV
jgi:hypothetical protein